MVLISEVIMVATTLITLCQSSPSRRGTKTRHGHWTVEEWSAISDQLIPGTSTGHDRRQSNVHPKRHRHNQNNRGKYEHLCDTTVRTVHLNTDTEEYNPPFYVEVRCRQPAQTHNYAAVQKCAFNLLHCVQTYSTMSFSRRKADGSDCWQPFTLDVPSGCECMWPIEEFGPLNRHDDL